MQPDESQSTDVVVSPETTPVEEPQVPETSVVPQATQPTDTIDYKAKYEDSERRRAGLDRKLSRLASQGTRTTGEENLFTGDEELDNSVLQHPLTRTALDKLATYQLKEGVEEVLKNFPNVPKDVVKAIKANPRGFVQSTTQTVDDAINDIEDYLTNTFGESIQPVEAGKEFPVVQPNTVATEPSEKEIEDMSADEITAALDSGKIKLSQLEEVVKKQSGRTEVKTTK